MAATSESESEVFEITDFTTASEWERFVSKVEEVLNEWKLIGNSTRRLSREKGDYTSGTWIEESQEINFVDFKFSITHYALVQEQDGSANVELEDDAFPVAMQDLLCTNNDFPPRAHCLVRWYGIREFVVISPGTNVEAIISESKCNLLLSSISISLGNSGCQVPMFVQIQQKWRRMYAGECQGPSVRTEFEMVHLRKVPSQYNHLSGLLDIFKSKSGYTMYPLPPINIAIRFTYILQDWQQYSWPLQPPDFDNILRGEVGEEEFGKLPFGACEETISELQLSTTWPDLAEGTVLDNDVYSDLDPLHAPHWSVRARAVENPQCLLGDLLTEFFKLCGRKETTEEVLGKGLAEEEGKDGDISSALSKLTEPAASVPISKLSVSNMMHNARRHIQRHRLTDESPLSAEILNSILQYLFTDSAVAKPSKNKTTPSNGCGKGRKDENTDDLYIQLKSAPVESLTYRLALCLCLVNFHHGGLRSVAYLWQEFVLELRDRWENNYQINGLPEEPPDLRCCLLHQKFQMLNCCIKRRQARDNLRKAPEGSKGRDHPNSRQSELTATNSSSETTAMPAGKSWDSWSDSEEEFFECLSDQGENDSQHNRSDKHGSKTRAEGRMHPFNNVSLINSSELLFIPVTQEPAPMTEDLLEEQSEILAKLGTSAEGAQLRARMQSACLLSDMESFKAANPGSVLEDFVRWYSPRDFVEDEVVNEEGETVLKGELSARMKIPGNMWGETWENARAVPANRQKRLFDDTKEAEKVLHYLELQKPADLTCHLLPCIIHAAILKVKEEASVDSIPSVKKNTQKATVQASKLLQQPNPDYNNIKDCLDFIITMETVIAQFRSLKQKFAIDEAENGQEREELINFINSLLEEPEVVVSGAGQGKVGGIIHRLFAVAQETVLLDKEHGNEDEMRLTEDKSKTQDFPSPAGREILLRTCVPRPAPYSKPLPQRLFCVLTMEEFRLVGAFSSDTSFF
ncbi:rab3 GTPase-activating protein catalytic subunit [Nerophis lumbriciformis]|uniref:rab3 GTPase-activating protein catalytic subunit n=1 Tax=Nerophis lumbriciformis TaxID=546530 RepID=UPI002AE002ED|nr:rab3 GTPase-activating protein catalytic subunit-like [Nerophis lumbriciformis]